MSLRMQSEQNQGRSTSAVRSEPRPFDQGRLGSLRMAPSRSTSGGGEGMPDPPKSNSSGGGNLAMDGRSSSSQTQEQTRRSGSLSMQQPMAQQRPMPQVPMEQLRPPQQTPQQAAPAPSEVQQHTQHQHAPSQRAPSPSHQHSQPFHMQQAMPAHQLAGAVPAQSLNQGAQKPVMVHAASGLQLHEMGSPSMTAQHRIQEQQRLAAAAAAKERVPPPRQSSVATRREDTSGLVSTPTANRDAPINQTSSREGSPLEPIVTSSGPSVLLPDTTRMRDWEAIMPHKTASAVQQQQLSLQKTQDLVARRRAQEQAKALERAQDGPLAKDSIILEADVVVHPKPNPYMTQEDQRRQRRNMIQQRSEVAQKGGVALRSRDISQQQDPTTARTRGLVSSPRNKPVEETTILPPAPDYYYDDLREFYDADVAAQKLQDEEEEERIQKRMRRGTFQDPSVSSLAKVNERSEAQYIHGVQTQVDQDWASNHKQLFRPGTLPSGKNTGNQPRFGGLNNSNKGRQLTSAQDEDSTMGHNPTLQSHQTVMDMHQNHVVAKREAYYRKCQQDRRAGREEGDDGVGVSNLDKDRPYSHNFVQRLLLNDLEPPEPQATHVSGGIDGVGRDHTGVHVVQQERELILPPNSPTMSRVRDEKRIAGQASATPRSVGADKTNDNTETKKKKKGDDLNSTAVVEDPVALNHNVKDCYQEIMDAWKVRPKLLPPVGWGAGGKWANVKGHEFILNFLYCGGVTPENSPSLVTWAMHAELLSCVQRLSYGTGLIEYSLDPKKSKKPMDRYGLVKLIIDSPKSKDARRWVPCFTWSKKRHSSTDDYVLPLTEVICVMEGWGQHEAFRPHLIDAEKEGRAQEIPKGLQLIKGALGSRNKTSELAANGCFTLFASNGHSLHFVTADPLVHRMWVTFFDRISSINAAMDITGRVRRRREDLLDQNAANYAQSRTFQNERSPRPRGPLTVR